ncbi:MAG: hypothetical protein Q9195_007043 [Heterodermia aff. obscurata]
MSTTSTDTAIYNPKDDLLSTSRFLGSSIESLSPSRNVTSRTSKTYKQARDLFLTRRLPEAYSAIQSLVNVPAVSDESPESDDPRVAPIATASRGQRIKVWSLYLTLLNAINELGPQEGEAQFGNKEWSRLTSKASDSSIWSEVVQNGYGGVEGNLDADVVVNLATLLLAQSPSQVANQQYLETYLSASNNPSYDFSCRFDSPNSVNGLTNGAKGYNGTNTPRDLTSRVKLIELYTLHVLPRNEEWDYAQDFIKMSETLDEDTRDSFLQSLDELRQDGETTPIGRAISPDDEDGIDQQLQQLEPRHEIETADHPEKQDCIDDSEATLKTPRRSHHQRTHSEHDYGIEPPKTQSSPKNHAHTPSQSKTAHSPTINGRKKPSSSSPGVYKRTATIMLNLQHLLTKMTHSLSKNPMALLRFVFFVLGLIVALSRRDVKERIARGWEKVRQTIGMGVKVSYI